MQSEQDTRRTRSERFAAFSRLRRQGKTQAQIADAFGVSRSLVQLVLSDPDGSRQRERRARISRPCPECGRLMDGSNGRGPHAPKLCRFCAAARDHEKRIWTAEAIIAAIRMFADEHGRPPTAREWTLGSRGRRFPPVVSVQREFGSWAEAIERAGFPRPRSGVRKWTPEQRAQQGERIRARGARESRSR